MEKVLKMEATARRHMDSLGFYWDVANDILAVARTCDSPASIVCISNLAQSIAVNNHGVSAGRKTAGLRNSIQSYASLHARDFRDRRLAMKARKK